MTSLPRRFATLILCLAVSACSLPRGAGFQSEVLAAAGAQTQTGHDFAVYEVTRRTVRAFAQWPDVGASSGPWIAAQDQPASLVIAPGDTLTITLWDAQENSVFTSVGQAATILPEMKVGTDGRIFVPYIGNLRVAGMSESTAREQIEQRMSLTIPSAQVQLAVTPGRANTANIVTGVAAPGAYPLIDRNVRVLDLIAQAGGVSSALENPQLRLIRGGRLYSVAFDRLLETPGLDTTVRGGDRLSLVEEDRYFLSLGAAGAEARHPFPQPRISALEALAIMGGVNDARADPQGILILRDYPASAVRSDGSGPPQERVVFTLDLTSADGLFSAGEFEVQTGDLVYATESPLNPALTVLSLGNTLRGSLSR